MNFSLLSIKLIVEKIYLNTLFSQGVIYLLINMNKVEIEGYKSSKEGWVIVPLMLSKKPPAGLS